jgi:hypothetical protein
LDQEIKDLEAIHQQVERRREKMLWLFELQKKIDEAAEKMRHIESRLEGVNRRNMKFTTLNTHYKPGLVLELKSSPGERGGKQIK